jgi:hypothetical protein
MSNLRLAIIALALLHASARRPIRATFAAT